MMRNSWLRNIQCFNDLAYTEPFAAAEAHDLLAGFIREGFGKVNCIFSHIDNLLFIQTQY
jgi:hypothetical protein